MNLRSNPRVSDVPSELNSLARSNLQLVGVSSKLTSAEDVNYWHRHTGEEERRAELRATLKSVNSFLSQPGTKSESIFQSTFHIRFPTIRAVFISCSQPAHHARSQSSKAVELAEWLDGNKKPFMLTRGIIIQGVMSTCTATDKGLCRSLSPRKLKNVSFFVIQDLERILFWEDKIR